MKCSAILRVARHSHCNAARRSGIVLVVVLVVVVLLSLAAYTFTDLMVTHHRAAQLNGRQVQTRALVDSGVEAVRMFLTQDEQTRFDMGGLYDNPTMFQGTLVVDDLDPQLRGRFSIINPLLDNDGSTLGYRYGLEDESSRINLQTLLAIEKLQENAGRDLLMALPGMTLEIADAILDWIDEDDEIREYGAEVDYYSSLDPPYAPKNGPLESVEELLLVRDVTAQLFFGSDANRNGNVEQRELENGQAFSSGDVYGSMDRGWSAYLTLYSRERQRSSLGLPKIDLNGDDLEQLYADLLTVLDPQMATYIIAYRQNGPYDGDEEAENPVDAELDFSNPGETQINSVLDLFGSKVQVTFSGESQASIIDIGISNDAASLQQVLPMLMDSVTTIDQEVMAGRININFAPWAVLAGLPGMTEDLVEQIIVKRSEFSFEPSDLTWQHPTWLLSEGLLVTEQGTPDLETMKQLLPFITARGSAYRAQVVGYYEGGTASSRVEVVFDTSGDVPRILFWRDISHLGRGYDLSTLGIDTSALGAGF